MNTVNALVDIARSFAPLEDEAAIMLDIGPDGVYVQAIRESYEEWKLFVADASGDESGVVNVFGFGKLHQPIPEVQGHFVLWNPSVLRGFDKLHTLSFKSIVFDDSHKVWFASFRDGNFISEVCLGSGKQKLEFTVPRLKLPFSKLCWTVEAAIADQFISMCRDAATAGIEDFWLFTTKRGQLCAAFDRKPKSNATPRIVLATGISNDYIVPYTFPAKRIVDFLKLMRNGSKLDFELVDDSCLKVLVTTSFGHYTFFVIGATNLIHRWGLDNLLPSSLPLDRLGYDMPCMYGNWEPEANPPR